MSNKSENAAVSPNRPALKTRFSPEAMAGVDPLIRSRRAADPAHRRASYKGARARYHLRLPEALVHDLGLISFLSGTPQNDFCRNALSDAAAGALEQLKNDMDPAHWDVLTKTFERQRKK